MTWRPVLAQAGITPLRALCAVALTILSLITADALIIAFGG